MTERFVTRSMLPQQIGGDDNVEYVEPNYIYSHQQANDPYYVNNNLWVGALRVTFAACCPNGLVQAYMMVY